MRLPGATGAAARPPKCTTNSPVWRGPESHARWSCRGRYPYARCRATHTEVSLSGAPFSEPPRRVRQRPRGAAVRSGLVLENQTPAWGWLVPPPPPALVTPQVPCTLRVQQLTEIFNKNTKSDKSQVYIIGSKCNNHYYFFFVFFPSRNFFRAASPLPLMFSMGSHVSSSESGLVQPFHCT